MVTSIKHICVNNELSTECRTKMECVEISHLVRQRHNDGYHEVIKNTTVYQTQLTAASRKSKLQTVKSFSLEKSPASSRWSQDSSTCLCVNAAAVRVPEWNGVESRTASSSSTQPVVERLH